MDAWFEWGQKGDGLPNETPGQTVSTEGYFGETIDGLSSGVTYEYRALSDNGVEVETRSVVEFTTDSFSCDKCKEKEGCQYGVPRRPTRPRVPSFPGRSPEMTAPPGLSVISMLFSRLIETI